MRHDPASAALVVMLRGLKMFGMAQAVTELVEQGAPAFEAAVPILSQLLKAEMAEREVRSIAYHTKTARFPAYKDLASFDFAASEVNEATIVRDRLFSDYRDQHGPFDIVGDVHGCLDELLALLAKLGSCFDCASVVEIWRSMRARSSMARYSACSAGPACSGSFAVMRSRKVAAVISVATSGRTHHARVPTV